MRPSRLFAGISVARVMLVGEVPALNRLAPDRGSVKRPSAAYEPVMDIPVDSTVQVARWGM